MQSPSIKQQIELHTSRGNNFLSQAVASESKDAYAKAIQEFVSSYKFALLLNSKDGMEQACAFKLGAAHIAGGDASRGISVLHTVLEHGTSKRPNISSSGIQSERGEVYFNLAIGYEKMNDIDAASNYYQRALLEYGNDEKNQQKAAETHLKLANMYNKESNFLEARKHFSNASDIYQNQGNTENMILALVCQANTAVLDTTVSRDECIRLLDSCCKKSAGLKHSNLQGKILCEVGLMYSTLSCLNRALLCFEKSIRLCDKNTNPRRRAVALQNAGAILNSMGYYKESIPRHTESAQIHGSLGNRNAQGQSFCNLAFAQSKLGYYEEAWESYLHALQAFKDTADKQGQWQCHEGLGSLAFNNGSLNRAIEHFTSALSFQTQKDDTISRNKIVRKLTNALEMRANRKVIQHSPRLAIEESKENFESPSPVKTADSSPTILQDNVAEDRKTPQKNTHARRRKKKRGSFIRGRRLYSDENDRPVQHIARGISNLTQNSNPFGDQLREDEYNNSSSDSTASSDLGAVFDMPRFAMFGSESDSDEDKKALSKPKNRRRFRNLVEASTMPINALSANRDKDAKTPDSVDSTPRTDVSSDRNVIEVYRDQLSKIEEKTNEDDFTDVTSKSTEESQSSSSSSEDENNVPKKVEPILKKITPVKPERSRVRIADDAHRSPSSDRHYVNDDLYTRSMKQTSQSNGTIEMTASRHMYESIKTANMDSPAKFETDREDVKEATYDEIPEDIIKQEDDESSDNDVRPLSSLYSPKGADDVNVQPNNSNPDPTNPNPASIVHTFDPPASYPSSSSVNMQHRPLPLPSSQSETNSKGKKSKKNQSRACSIM